MFLIFKQIKPPSDSLLKHYQEQYIRNQNKWIRRSKLMPEHLNQEFLLDGEEFWLRGSVSPVEVVVEKKSTSEFFFMSIDPVTKSILGEPKIEN
jgi:hypothetical protein